MSDERDDVFDGSWNFSRAGWESPVCAARSPENYFCTRPPGHPGDHAAFAGIRFILRWRNADEKPRNAPPASDL